MAHWGGFGEHRDEVDAGTALFLDTVHARYLAGAGDFGKSCFWWRSGVSGKAKVLKPS